MDNLDKALSLARIGVKVFPVDRKTGRPLIPKSNGGRGFYDATDDDYELIATWFSLDYPEGKTAVGYWAGGSGLFVCDIDRGKKNGKNGFHSIKSRGLDADIGDTQAYATKSGGQHRVFQTNRIDLTLSEDHDGLEGVDIRAGGSYAVWWGDDVPESRDAFSANIPAWMVKPVEIETEFTGEGFSGGTAEWLDSIPDDVLPSSRVRDLLARIPVGDFGHNEMVDLAWSAVRLGSERETGVRGAIKKIREAWLRGEYDTPKYRRDFDLALSGAINKGGRVQRPVPAMTSLVKAMAKASETGVADRLKSMERKVSETASELDLARARKAMFEACAKAQLPPSVALGIVTGSRSFKNSKVTVESAWFGDGEPEYHELMEAETAPAEDEEGGEEKESDEDELANLMTRLSRDAEAFTFLSKKEKTLVASYEWWGQEYLDWVKTRLKHFNAPYHTGAMWAVLSTIASQWGKVPLQGHKPTDCNLYLNILGDSSSGKSEAWGFGQEMIDAYFGTEYSPIVGDTKKVSALSLHRTLILRDGEPSLVYSDEVQGFFQDLQSSHWQGSILADLSDYYGGQVPPKNTMNDKEISGKRAKSLLTTYFTGIADMSLDAINIDNWRSGFFYRFLWGFGHPRKSGDFEITLESSSSSYTATMEAWAREFKRVGALQETKWGPGRIVMWDTDALRRMSGFAEQIDKATKKSPLHDTIFVPANGRFLTSIMKCATIVALTEASEKVTMRHALIALSFAGPWHRSMVLAIQETGKESFDREVEKCLVWIKRNAVKQIGKDPWIQRSAVMRAFRPNESAERMLRQLTEEGWLLRAGDVYQVAKGIDS